jgi:hypothetical protein
LLALPAGYWLGDLKQGSASLHDHIRATHNRRRDCVVISSLLAASIFASVMLLVSASAIAASTTASIDPKESIALPPDSGTAREIRFGPAERGSERLELSAKLTEDGGLIQRPIAWKLHRLGGETVFAADLAAVTIPVEPGDYVAEAKYGTVHAVQRVTLLSGQHLTMTLMLNVGGIRVLSRLSGIGLPAVRPLTTVYATSGLEEGKLITISDEPGEIVRLAAGNYHVESRFAFGNAIATAEVTVKPGLLSSVEIDHHAGVAHLSAGSVSFERGSWTISDDKGSRLAGMADGDIVLMPGRYVAHADFGEQHRIMSFTVEAGKRVEVEAR